MKTKILQFICPTGFYGAERWVLALANNLDVTKYQCDLAVTVEPSQDRLEIVKQYPKHAGECFELNASGPFDPSVIRQLTKVIKDHGISIIHTHGYKSDIIGLIAAKLTGIKCVATPHGFGLQHTFKHKAYVKLGAWALRFVDGVAPLSTELVDDCLASGVPERLITYIKNGVDLKEVEQVRTKESASPAEPVVGFIGQMIPRKNIRDILEIFSEISEEIGGLQLELLGDGDSRAELEALAANMPYAENIHFLGFRNDRLEKLKGFSLFAMSSTSEGIPRCLMEAMAMGIPVAAYDIPGIDQLIEHEKTGLLATLHDRESLKSAWRKILTNHEYAKSLGEQGRQFVLKEYSAARMASEYEALFTTLLEQQ
jgi:glycosyltransferase involved in cell wall biosynthesis